MLEGLHDQITYHNKKLKIVIDFRDINMRSCNKVDLHECLYCQFKDIVPYNMFIEAYFEILTRMEGSKII